MHERQNSNERVARNDKGETGMPRQAKCFKVFPLSPALSLHSPH
ncbi:hypothetical protein [Prevotella sp. OH937_COT-195]|nr:hypothetical protein [Prevotella sp. OH937_COT-195]